MKRASLLRRAPLLLPLLAVLAILLAPLAPLAPTPVSAQSAEIEILSATLRPLQLGSDLYGCTGSGSSAFRCASAARLTDNTFDYNGVSYEIDQLSNNRFTGNTLDFSLTTAIPASLNSVLTLYIDGTPFALADATTTTDGVRWSNTGLGWTSTHTVSLKLTISAYPADLDPTFGIGGKVTTPFNTKASEIHAVAEQDDGKIVVVGWVQNTNKDFALARYNTDGSLDTAFGTGGRVSTDFGSADEARAVAIQSDGKIVVAGYALDSNTGNDFAAARYNTDGSLDTAFDTDGKLTTNMGATDEAHAVAIQSDGKIVLAGQTGHSFGVARYTTAGALDTAFDTDGKQSTSFTAGVFDVARAVATQSDGKIVVAGYALDSNTGNDFAAARYNTDGSLDTAFDTDGKLTTNMGATDEAHAVAIQSDGKIVLAGQTGHSFGVARYTTAGALDTAFDTDGKQSTSFTAGVFDVARAVATQSDGKIVLAGYATNTNGTPAVTTDDHKDFALARYTTTGVLDTGFDTDGKVTTAIGSTTDDEINDIALDGDGKIVAAGYTHQGTYREVALARYTTAGALDTAFDSNSSVVTQSIGNLTDVANSVAVQSDGNIMVAGYSYSSISADDFMLARWTPPSASAAASPRPSAPAATGPGPWRCSPTARSSRPATATTAPTTSSPWRATTTRGTSWPAISASAAR